MVKRNRPGIEHQWKAHLLKEPLNLYNERRMSCSERKAHSSSDQALSVFLSNRIVSSWGILPKYCNIHCGSLLPSADLRPWICFCCYNFQFPCLPERQHDIEKNIQTVLEIKNLGLNFPTLPLRSYVTSCHLVKLCEPLGLDEYQICQVITKL